MACTRWMLSAIQVPSARSLLCRPLSTTCVLHGKRRKMPELAKWGLEAYPREHNSSKILQDMPDFTYLDGRQTPLTKAQLERKQRNYDLAKRIVMLTEEMKTAKANHAQKIEQEKNRRENVVNSKLKQKSSEV